MASTTAGLGTATKWREVLLGSTPHPQLHRELPNWIIWISCSSDDLNSLILNTRWWCSWFLHFRFPELEVCCCPQRKWDEKCTGKNGYRLYIWHFSTRTSQAQPNSNCSKNKCHNIFFPAAFFLETVSKRESASTRAQRRQKFLSLPFSHFSAFQTASRQTSLHASQS